MKCLKSNGCWSQLCVIFQLVFLIPLLLHFLLFHLQGCLKGLLLPASVKYMLFPLLCPLPDQQTNSSNRLHITLHISIPSCLQDCNMRTRLLWSEISLGEGWGAGGVFRSVTQKNRRRLTSGRKQIDFFLERQTCGRKA